MLYRHHTLCPLRSILYISNNNRFQFLVKQFYTHTVMNDILLFIYRVRIQMNGTLPHKVLLVTLLMTFGGCCGIMTLKLLWWSAERLSLERRNVKGIIHAVYILVYYEYCDNNNSIFIIYRYRKRNEYFLVSMTLLFFGLWCFN